MLSKGIIVHLKRLKMQTDRSLKCVLSFKEITTGDGQDVFISIFVTGMSGLINCDQ